MTKKEELKKVESIAKILTWVFVLKIIVVIGWFKPVEWLNQPYMTLAFFWFFSLLYTFIQIKWSILGNERSRAVDTFYSFVPVISIVAMVILRTVFVEEKLMGNSFKFWWISCLGFSFVAIWDIVIGTKAGLQIMGLTDKSAVNLSSD